MLENLRNINKNLENYANKKETIFKLLTLRKTQLCTEKDMYLHYTAWLRR